MRQACDEGEYGKAPKSKSLQTGTVKTNRYCKRLGRLNESAHKNRCSHVCAYRSIGLAKGLERMAFSYR